jgi:hypothetical protein
MWHNPPALAFLNLTLAGALILPARVVARLNGDCLSPPLSAFQTASLPTNQQRRILAFRRSETPDGVRLTLTSDTPLDDYRSYVEGERFFVHIPQAALAIKQQNPQGRGFADLRIEQREDAIVISFRLQPGASVNIKQLFHQLHVIFYTNERQNNRSNVKTVKPS